MFNYILNPISNHPETLLFLPSYILLGRYYNNIEISRLFYHSVILTIGGYELIKNNDFYNMQNLNLLRDYNWYGEKCLLLGLYYYTYDMLYIYTNKEFFFHHYWCIVVIIYSFTYNRGGNLILYLTLNELPILFSDLKLLNFYPKLSDNLFKINFVVFKIMFLPFITYHLSTQYDFYTYSLIIDCLLHAKWIYMSCTNQKIL
jgi:hypothetical protein